MNKYQRALDELDDGFHNLNNNDVDKIVAVFKELVDKATPKKVVKGGGWNCPNCSMKLLSGHDLTKENINFCFECGQELDWENDETKPTRIYSEVTIKDGEATFTATDENGVSTKVIVTRY